MAIGQSPSPSPSQQQQFTLADDCYDDPSQLSQLLRRRAATHEHAQFTTLFVSPAKAAQPTATSRRVTVESSYVRPTLPQHHSAPTSTTILRDCGHAERLHHTFAGTMDAPGDTQPDSQIYRDWTSGVFDSGLPIADTGPPTKSLLNHTVAKLDFDKDADTATDGVEHEGSSQEQQSPAVTDPTIMPDDDAEELQLRITAPLTSPLTSPLKFQTPVMAGHKRDSHGQILSSGIQTATTPGTTLTAAVFFGTRINGEAIGNNMSLTQVFNATQAHTSPIAIATSEDVIFQRPSPDFTNARNSSPVPIESMSSPLKQASTEGYLRSSSEPKGKYVTMKQSQDRRGTNLQNQPSEITAQDSWEEPTVAERRAATRRARAQFDQEAGKSFAKITAPSSSPPPTRRKRHHLLPITKSTKRNASASSDFLKHSAYDGPYDVVENNGTAESPDVLFQSTLLNGHEYRNVSPDELLLAESSSAIKHHDIASNKIQVPNTSSHSTRPLSSRSIRVTPPESPSSRPQREPQLRRTYSQVSRPGSPPMASVKIMDSQPDSILDRKAITRPKSLLIPSSPSVNQYSIDQTTLARNTGYTSQGVPSSAPPMPPKASSVILQNTLEENVDIEIGARVPSSPPGLGMEDIVYDEHCYNEHSSANGDPGDDLSKHSTPSRGSKGYKDVDDGLPRPKTANAELRDSELCESPRLDDGIAESECVEDDDVTIDLNRVHEADAAAEFKSNDGINQQELVNVSVEGDDTIQSSHPEDEQEISHRLMQPPRMQRQSTVPESDVMEDTQPSTFVKGNAIATRARDHIPESGCGAIANSKVTDSTEPYHTAPEGQSAALTNSGPDHTPRKRSERNTTSISHFRSLQDIANLPNTQDSTENTDIEMPMLSFNDNANDELDAGFPGSSLVKPLAKKRKVTHSAKKMTYADSGKEIAVLSPPTSLFRNGRVTTPDNVTPTSISQRGPQSSYATAHTKDDAVFARSATLRTDVPQNVIKLQSSKIGALKPINKALPRTPPKLNQLPTAAKLPLPSDQSTKPNTTNVGALCGDIDEETDELAGPTPHPSAKIATVANSPDHGEIPTGRILAPNRVIASWPGLGFYPATCLGRNDSHHLRVRYDDGSVHSLEPTQVRAMELKIGDQVKVDEPGYKKNIYIIVGFKDKVETLEGLEHPTTDRYGYKNVVLGVKQRDGLPKPQLVQQSVISVPMQKLYFTNVLWGKLGDRHFKLTPPPSPTALAPRTTTPVCATDETVPPSLQRRSNLGQAFLKDTITRAVSVSSSVRTNDNRTFTDMAFAVTFTLESSDKDAIAQSITSNGGQILNDGFHELFKRTDDLPDLLRARTDGLAEADILARETLILKEEFKELRFVALITDSHCRRTKYIQALALNIPCVHYRWLTDSIVAGRPLAFAKFLLPAGLSTNFGREGIVRSRVMPIYDPGASDLLFLRVLQGRPTLLDGERILLITGKTKKDVERKKPYHFLTLALAPSAVLHCTDLVAAKKLLQQGEWGWVYVDGGAADIAEAVNVLFDNRHARAAAGKGPKNKRKENERNRDHNALVSSGKINGITVHIICDEFIVQSLILGALIEG